MWLKFYLTIHEKIDEIIKPLGKSKKQLSSVRKCKNVKTNLNFLYPFNVFFTLILAENGSSVIKPLSSGQGLDKNRTQEEKRISLSLLIRLKKRFFYLETLNQIHSVLTGLICFSLKFKSNHYYNTHLRPKLCHKSVRFLNFLQFFFFNWSADNQNNIQYDT